MGLQEFWGWLRISARPRVRTEVHILNIKVHSFKHLHAAYTNKFQKIYNLLETKKKCLEDSLSDKFRICRLRNSHVKVLSAITYHGN